MNEMHYNNPSPRQLDQPISSLQKRSKNNKLGVRYRKQSDWVPSMISTSRQTNNNVRATSDLSSITISEWHSKTFSGPASREVR